MTTGRINQVAALRARFDPKIQGATSHTTPEGTMRRYTRAGTIAFAIRLSGANTRAPSQGKGEAVKRTLPRSSSDFPPPQANDPEVHAR
jgi:hypothetical protein